MHILCDKALIPLAALYGLITRIRNVCYDKGWFKSYASPLPVFSVGNLTSGGNGKTPLVSYLVQGLQDRGFFPVVLSRGYGGKEVGPIEVESLHTPWEVGDEPVMLFEQLGVPIVVSRDRVAGANFIHAQQLGNVIVLDDGFQHRRLRRTLDIITINIDSEEATENFLAAKLLPRGRFREHWEKGLKRADIVVFSRRRMMSAPTFPDLDARLLERVPKHCHVFQSTLTVKELPLSPQSVVAIAGLGNPEGFFLTLESLGFHLEARYAYPDHQEFSSEQIEALQIRHPNIPFLCTEKDWVKIRRLGVEQVFPLKVSIKLDRPEHLWKIFKETL